LLAPLLDDPVAEPVSSFPPPPPSSVELPHAVPSAITKDATMITRRLFIENSSTKGNRGLQMRDAEHIFGSPRANRVRLLFCVYADFLRIAT
jgi:hypothetical protein